MPFGAVTCRVFADHFDDYLQKIEHDRYLCVIVMVSTPRQMIMTKRSSNRIDCIEETFSRIRQYKTVHGLDRYQFRASFIIHFLAL